MILGFGKSKLKTLIDEKAEKYSLDFEIVASVIWQESKGRQWAFRFEPAFFEKYISNQSPLIGHVPHTISLQSEKIARATSFGLMQIMGQVARERGFEEKELTQLLIPETNLEWGCRFLYWCFKVNLLDKAKALNRWNGGGDKVYSERIFEHIRTKAYEAMW